MSKHHVGGMGGDDTIVAGHHAADAGGESEHVGDGGRVQQLVLNQEKHISK